MIKIPVGRMHGIYVYDFIMEKRSTCAILTIATAEATPTMVGDLNSLKKNKLNRKFQGSNIFYDIQCVWLRASTGHFCCPVWSYVEKTLGHAKAG